MTIWYNINRKNRGDFMSKKLLGILTPVLLIIVMIIVAIVTGVVVSQSSSDGWAALGAILMVFMLTGLFLIITLIIGLVKYFKDKSEYGLGILLGLLYLFLFSSVATISSLIYNTMINM